MPTGKIVFKTNSGKRFCIGVRDNGGAASEKNLKTVSKEGAVFEECCDTAGGGGAACENSSTQLWSFHHVTGKILLPLK